MADTLGLEHVYNTIVAAYAAESDATPHSFGWEQVPRQLQSRARILWVPGDPGGSVGSDGPPRDPGAAPARPLASLRELFHVYIHGWDSTQPKTNELAHWRAARFAYDTWRRHFYNATHGVGWIDSLNWNPSTRPNEFRHGATILVVGAILSVIPDAQDELITPVDGSVSLTELDVTESITIDNGAAP